MAEEQLTVVFVTHDLDQAARVASRAALLVDGRIAAVDTPGAVAETWARMVA